MRPGVRGIAVSAVARVGGLGIALLLCSPQLLVLGVERNSNKIMFREEVSLARRNELAGKLRAISGWADLSFDNTGTLQRGATDPVGGSATARGLINRALSGANFLILEDASNRTDVVFCKVIPGRWKDDLSQKPSVFVVLIDFADFEHLIGDTAALNAFNVGWGVLHEFDHVVNDSEDSIAAGETGECEDHINQMRRECNLPRRTDYFFTDFPQAGQGAFITRFVRLAFEEEETSKGKRHRYWVVWDANVVGGVNEQKQVASLQ